MVQIIHLAPHDPVPAPGAHGLILRRLGEDDPAAIVTEVSFYGTSGRTMLAQRPDGTAMTIEEAIHFARGEAPHHGAGAVYVLDRTKGVREQEVIRAHGAHNFPADVLADSDPEDGEAGSDLRDRPHDAGFMR